jgi:Fe-S-cluster-containing hydrogenase component 2
MAMVPKDELMKSDRQVAMVFDLNKCIGCQTCAVACKVLWMQDEGMDYQWWCTVNTQPGRGHPRDYESMGGGYRDGVPFPARSAAAAGTSTTTRSSTAAKAPRCT